MSNYFQVMLQWTLTPIFLPLFGVWAVESETCSSQGSCTSEYATFQFDGWELPYGLFSNQLEEVEDYEMKVKVGAIPGFLDGSLYRIGAGMYHLEGERRVNNLIDALGKLHRWSFNTKTGRASFSCKFIRSDIYNRTMQDRELPPMPHMGQTFPQLTTLQTLKIVLWDAKSDNTNVAVWNLGNTGVTTTTEQPLYLDHAYDSLNFLRKYVPPSDNKSAFTFEMLSASHFTRHPVSGNSINYKLTLPMDKGIFSGMNSPAYNIYEYTSSGSDDKVVASLIGSVPVASDDLRIVHSLGVTENFVVLPRFNMFLERKSPVDIGANIYWDASKPAVFDIVSIKTKKVTSFKFSAYEAQHIINSFERVNSAGELEVVADFPTRVYPVDFSEETIYDVLNVDNWKKSNWKYSDDHEIDPSSKGRITRFIMNLNTGQGIETDFPVMWNAPINTQVEFPIINPAYVGRAYCFTYMQVSNHELHSAAGIVKLDLCRETSVGWEQKNKFPVEPIFVARPGALAEDDGVLMSPVFDSTNNSTLYRFVCLGCEDSGGRGDSR